MVFFALANALGGEIFVPKIPSYRITDLAEAIGPDCEHPVIGIRPGEKLHEEMITASDSQNTIETNNYYVIVPNSQGASCKSVMDRYLTHYKARQVAPGFCYSSGENTDWLNAAQIRDLIKTHVDPAFAV
jgi:FlaA1/EpsC-like NDP-sugar epimerase